MTGRLARLAAGIVAVVTRPGALVCEQRAGTRDPWMGAMPVFLAVAAIFALLGPVRERVFPPAASPADAEIAGMVGDSASFAADPDVADNLLVRMLGPGRTWTLVTHPDVATRAAVDAFPVAMLLLIPFVAALTWLTWGPGRFGYDLHFAFSLDLHSAVFTSFAFGALADALGITVLSVLVGVGAVVYTSWYAWVACREGLGGTTGELAARTTIVGLLYTPAVMALAAVVALRALA